VDVLRGRAILYPWNPTHLRGSLHHRDVGHMYLPFTGQHTQQRQSQQTSTFLILFLILIVEPDILILSITSLNTE